MKQYPTIPGFFKCPNKEINIYAFDKIDGSNIRVEWNKKKGFHKFGTRKRLLDERNELLGGAINLFEVQYKYNLDNLFKSMKLTKAIAFFEVWGLDSFAGRHDNGLKYITLLDISIDKKGILEPKEFIKLPKHIYTPKLLYIGKINQDFIDSVKNGTLDGMTYEGVVCKGSYVSPGLPYMCKIKNKAWINKLKDYCGDNIDLFNELI